MIFHSTTRVILKHGFLVSAARAEGVRTRKKSRREYKIQDLDFIEWSRVANLEQQPRRSKTSVLDWKQRKQTSRRITPNRPASSHPVCGGCQSVIREGIQIQRTITATK